MTLSCTLSSLILFFCVWWIKIYEQCQNYCLEWLCNEMSARLELLKMDESDAAAHVLLKTVGIVIVV